RSTQRRRALRPFNRERSLLRRLQWLRSENRLFQVLARMHQPSPGIVQQAGTSVLVRKQALLDHVQKPIDRERDRWNDSQDQQNGLAMSAPLRSVDDVAQP